VQPEPVAADANVPQATASSAVKCAVNLGLRSVVARRRGQRRLSRSFDGQYLPGHLRFSARTAGHTAFRAVRACGRRQVQQQRLPSPSVAAAVPAGLSQTDPLHAATGNGDDRNLAHILVIALGFFWVRLGSVCRKMIC